MAAFAKVALAQRAGLLGDLADGLLGETSTSTPSTATATAAAKGGVVGGIINGVSSIVGGVTSAVGDVTSAIGGILPTQTAKSSPLSLSLTSTATSSIPASTAASSSLPSSLSSAQSSLPPVSSAPPLTTSSTASAPAATTAPPSSSGTAALADAISPTTLTTTTSLTGSPTSTPQTTGFLANKGLAAGVFTVTGIVGLILLFILATWFVRRRRHSRFEEEALDFAPTTHLNPITEDSGYPASMHRSSSNGSQFSRRAPTATYGRESPERMYQAGGYGATQGAMQNYGSSGYGYYNQGVPQQPYTTAQMQQAFASNGLYAQPLPAALRPGPQQPPAQNPFEASPINRTRSPSPSNSELAYAGYVGAGGADDRVQVGRKISITKASATVKSRPPALQLPAQFGNDAASSLKVVNG